MIMVSYASLMEVVQCKEEWSYATIMFGLEYVLIVIVITLLEQFVTQWVMHRVSFFVQILHHFNRYYKVF